MTAEELDLKSIQYTYEFDAKHQALYANAHEQEVRVSERQQAYQDGYKAALLDVSDVLNEGQSLIDEFGELLE